MEAQIKNAQIEGTTIDREHGCLTAWVYLDYGGAGQGFGGLCLDRRAIPPSGERRPSAFCGAFIAGVLKAVGADSWEKLKGMSCRVRASHDGVEAIGHFLKDQWFCPANEFERLRKTNSVERDR